MSVHEIIETLSPLWWKGIVTCFIVISLIILLLKNKSIEFKEKTNKYFAYFAILVYLATNIYTILIGDWTVKDFLPLHLCNISYFICILVLLNKKKMDV